MLDKVISELKKNRNVFGIYQFGSYGTQKYNPALSDIDICVFTKNIDRATLLEMSSFGTDKLDISVFDTLPTYLKPEVFKGKPLWIKDRFLIARKFAVSFRESQDFKKYQQEYWKTLKKRIAHEKS